MGRVKGIVLNGYPFVEIGLPHLLRRRIIGAHSG